MDLEIEVNALVERIQNGDEGAFALLCEKYTALTESAVRRFLPSLGVENGVPLNETAADPDEVRQDAIMALYKAAMTYDVHGTGQKVSFGLYAKICINNAMITKVRKYKRRRRKLERNVSMAPQKHHRQFAADVPWQGMGPDALSEALKNAVESLSPYERKVFQLYIDGKSTGEMASELNRTEKSVSNACYRVKSKIKELLKN